MAKGNTSKTTYNRRQAAIGQQNQGRSQDNHDSQDVLPQLSAGLSSSIEKAIKIASGRVLEETKQQYKYVFGFITSYFAKKYPQALNIDGKLIIPIDENLVMAFFGDMSDEIPANESLKGRKRNRAPMDESVPVDDSVTVDESVPANGSVEDNK